MSDAVADHVRTIVAEILNAVPQNIRAETALSLGDLGWKGLLMITLEIEHKFGIELPIEVQNGWTTVADIILDTEKAIAVDRGRDRERAA
jgi:acyl carrier protein